MRNSIWNELRRMQNEMDMMFDHFFGSRKDERLLEGPHKKGMTALSDYRSPFGNICETDKDVIAAIELPGAKKEDIKVNITDNNLEVKVEKKHEDKNGNSISSSYMGFYRSFSLPSNIDQEKIKASYKNGVLELKIPKTEDKKKKNIMIE